jgi:hypothetical protein
MLLSAAAWAEAPIATDMPEYIVTAKYPEPQASDDHEEAAPPALIVTPTALDTAAILEAVRVEQTKAATTILAALTDSAPSQSQLD